MRPAFLRQNRQDWKNNRAFPLQIVYKCAIENHIPPWHNNPKELLRGGGNT